MIHQERKEIGKSKGPMRTKKICSVKDAKGQQSRSTKKFHGGRTGLQDARIATQAHVKNARASAVSPKGGKKRCNQCHCNKGILRHCWLRERFTCHRCKCCLDVVTKEEIEAEIQSEEEEERRIEQMMRESEDSTSEDDMESKQ